MYHYMTLPCNKKSYNDIYIELKLQNYFFKILDKIIFMYYNIDTS